MSLSERQRNLDDASAQWSSQLDGPVTPAERLWLLDLDAPAERLATLLLLRRRRQQQISEAARLTAGALRRGTEAHRLDEYLELHPAEAPSSSQEVLRFLAFVNARTDDILVGSVARFESAILEATEERAAGRFNPKEIADDDVLRLHPQRVVVLPAAPEQVIVSVAMGEALPLLDRHPVLVGPGIPALWRAASRAEDVLCSWLVRPRSMHSLGRMFVGYEATLQGLVDAGVLHTGAQ